MLKLLLKFILLPFWLVFVCFKASSKHECFWKVVAMTA